MVEMKHREFDLIHKDNISRTATVTPKETRDALSPNLATLKEVLRNHLSPDTTVEYTNIDSDAENPSRIRISWPGDNGAKGLLSRLTKERGIKGIVKKHFPMATEVEVQKDSSHTCPG